MTFTYASTAPASSDRSYIRLRIGDTSSGSARFSDEELDAFLSVESNKYLAAAVAAESLMALYATKVDKSVGRLRISMQQASGHFSKLAMRLRAEASMRVAPYAGGISIADKQDQNADTDRVNPSFSMGQYDDPSARIDIDLSTD